MTTKTSRKLVPLIANIRNPVANDGAVNRRFFKIPNSTNGFETTDAFQMKIIKDTPAIKKNDKLIADPKRNMLWVMIASRKKNMVDVRARAPIQSK